MAPRNRTDPAVDQIAAFIQYVSRLALSDRVHDRFADAARVMTRSELSALRILAREGPLTYGDLSERLRLDRTTISRLATHLVDTGLVTRTTDDTDRRRAWLAITPDGNRGLATVEDLYLEYYEAAIADWTAEEREATRAVLDRLERALRALDIDESGRVRVPDDVVA
jgi:hypothetical protein